VRPASVHEARTVLSRVTSCSSATGLNVKRRRDVACSVVCKYVRARGAWSGRHGCPVLVEVARGVLRLRGRSLALKHSKVFHSGRDHATLNCGDFLASTLIEGCLLANSPQQDYRRWRVGVRDAR